MAHWRYPSSIAQRDKFRQMIAQANPELFAHAGDRVGSVSVPEGTRLNIPEGLPIWESAASSSLAAQESNSVSSAAGATPKLSAQPSSSSSSPLSPLAPPPPATHPASPSDTAHAATRTQGRLIIGSGRVPALTVQEFRQTLDRLEELMNDKTRTESALSDTLTSLISNFGEVKKYLTLMDDRLKKAEAEQQQLRTEMQSLRDELQNSFNLIELLIAIIGGGAVGAGLVLFFRRRIFPPTPTSPYAPLSGHGDPRQAAGSNSSDTPSAQAAFSTSVSSVKQSGSRLSDTPSTRLEHDTTSLPRAPITVPQEPSTEQATPAAVSATPSVLSTASVAFSSPTSSDSDLSAPAAPATAPAVPLNTQLQIPAAQNEAEFSATPATPAAPVDSMDTPLHPSVDPAIELADLMMSLGLAQEAARALLEHIQQNQQNQHQDPAHWFKVLDIYRKTDQRSSFNKIAQELNKALNVAVASWDMPAAEKLPCSLEDYPHLMMQLRSLWPKPESEAFLIYLLEDNRNGQRTGFSQPVIEEIMLLRSLLKIIPIMDFPAIELG